MRRRLVRGLRLWGLRLRLMRRAADEGGCCERLWRAADAANAAGVTASAAAEAAADTAVVIHLRVLLHTSMRYPLFPVQAMTLLSGDTANFSTLRSSLLRPALVIFWTFPEWALYT